MSEPRACRDGRGAIQAYLLGGDVSAAELRGAFEHGLACERCRSSPPVSVLLAQAEPPGGADAGGAGRRLLVAVGCEQYEHHPRLRLVPETLERVEELFCGAGGLGYERASLGVGESPTRQELIAALQDWFAGAGLRPEDVVVVWFSGHGLVDRRGRLRLAASDSLNGGIDAGRLFGELLAASGVQRALVVVDGCHSEGLSAGVLSSFERELSHASRQPEPTSSRFPDAGFVFIAGNERAKAGPQGALVDALEYALRDRLLGGFTMRALDPRRVVEVVNERLAEGCPEGDRRRALVAAGPSPGRFPPVLPNLHFRDVPATPGEVEGHWDPTARGVAADLPDLEAWRFTGRDAARRALCRWIEGSAAADALVVTGDPGSGKSALLAWAVTLSAPAYRERAERAGALADAAEGTVPPAGSVGCAAWARQKTPEILLAELHVGLFGEPADPEARVRDALKTRLRERPGDPPLVAVDALDEATDPSGVAAALAGLAGAGLVRLVVGTRRHEADAPVPPDLAVLRPDVIDLDAADYLDEGDVVAYAQRTLVETNRAYRGEVALELAGRSPRGRAAASCSRASSRTRSRAGPPWRTPQRPTCPPPSARRSTATWGVGSRTTPRARRPAGAGCSSPRTSCARSPAPAATDCRWPRHGRRRRARSPKRPTPAATSRPTYPS